MRRALWFAAVVAVGLAAPAWAEQEKKEEAKKTSGRPAMIEEHRLVVVDRDRVRANRVSEEIEREDDSKWARDHLAAGEDFADPFIGFEIYPEVSAGIAASAARLQSTKTESFRSTVDLSFWALELQVPVLQRLGSARTDSSVGLRLKLPFAWPGAPSHRLALAWSAIIPRSGPAFSDSSRVDLGYAFAKSGFTLQGRIGYGYEQLFVDQPLRLGLQYGGLIGYRFGVFQPIVEVDGTRTVGTKSSRVALAPGFRINPTAAPELQLGAAAIINLKGGTDNPGRRYGAFLDLSYNFL